MLDKLKKLFKAEEPQPEVKSKPKKKSAKDIATERGEPYVAIIGIEVDPENIHQGAFELDWNDKFVADLIRHGYQGKTDADIVDQWFQSVCRNVVLETFEKEQPLNQKPLYK
jgi:hypothetical protein